MSRSILEIYNNVVDLYNENDLDETTVIDYNNYSGDSQIISNDFLKEMFRLLLILIDNTAKGTSAEPYSSSDIVVFDSGWWGLTVNQNSEINEYFKQGFGIAPVSRRFWNVDENGSYVQSKVAATRASDTNSNIIYNGELVSITGSADRIDIALNGQFNDRYRLEDFTEIVNGDLFDPSLIKMETRTEINSWFVAYDGVLSVLNGSIFAGGRIDTPSSPDYAEYNCRMSVTIPFRPVSDRYEATSSFTLFDWIDDDTGDSGQVVKQSVVLRRRGFPSVESQGTDVYSENVTFKVDDGEGGFDTITLKKSDNGVSFGDSLTILYNSALSKFSNTNTYNLGTTHNRSDTITTVLEQEYAGGSIVRQGNGFFEVADRAVGLSSNINTNQGGYSFINYVDYVSKTYSTWSGSSEDVLNAGSTEIEESTRNGDPDTYSISDFSGFFGMLDVDVEGDFTINTITTINKGILDDRVETHILIPPN